VGRAERSVHLPPLPYALALAPTAECFPAPENFFSKTSSAKVTLAAGAQSVITLPQARGPSPSRDRGAPEEFGSILVAPERRSPEYLQKFIQSKIEKWAPLIKMANIKAE
jgi:hypothetical protein